MILLLWPIFGATAHNGNSANARRHARPPCLSNKCFVSISKNAFERRCANTIVAPAALISLFTLALARLNLKTSYYKPGVMYSQLEGLHLQNSHFRVAT